MSPADISLANCLGREGFSVYVPLLFGEVKQDNFVRGYFQTCLGGDYECSKLSTRSTALDWIGEVCEHVRKSNQPVGAIGMCLTGIFPVSLLRNGVAAAVLCQPTVPFNWLLGRPVGAQEKDLGLDPTDLGYAETKSTVPMLAMRYMGDRRCPEERMKALQDTFPGRIAVIEIPRDGHSTLAGDFDACAFADTVAYLKVMLGVEAGPKRMREARLNGRACELTAEGKWRAVS